MFMQEMKTCDSITVEIPATLRLNPGVTPTPMARLTNTVTSHTAVSVSVCHKPSRDRSLPFSSHSC